MGIKSEARRNEIIHIIQSNPISSLQDIADKVGVTREWVRQICIKLQEVGTLENRLDLKRRALEEEAIREREKTEQIVGARRHRKRIWRRMTYISKRLRLRHSAGLDRYGMSRDYHMPGIEVVCQFEGCNRPVDSRGFCPLHYMKLRATGALWVRRRFRSTCKEDNCRMSVYARNMCSNHYNIYMRKNRERSILPHHNTSGFRGVSANSGKWQANIHIPKKGQKGLGLFDSKEMAARAYDTAARKYIGDGAKLNFPNENIEVVYQSRKRTKEERAAAARKNLEGHPIGVSGYRGIYWDGGKQQWIVRIWRGSERIYVGRFIDLDQAAHVQDSAARYYLGEDTSLNFPDETPAVFEANHVARSPAQAHHKRKPGGSSKYRGVTKAKNRWAARIEVERQSIRLGSFVNEEDAARAYDAAARRYFGVNAVVNFDDR